MPNIHLITSCTDRKRGDVPDELRVRSLRAGNVGDRVTEWLHRLASTPVLSVPASGVYVGEHWSIVRRLLTKVNRCSVVSAGYGFIDAGTPIAPYAATFVTGHPDSVGSAGSELVDWWRHVNQWSGPSGHRPTVSDDDITVVAMSPGYLKALAPELTDRDPDRVMVISAGGNDQELPRHRLPVGGALRLSLGGSLMSLNVRVAEHLVDHLHGDASRASALQALEELSAKSGELPRFDRLRVTDTQVLTLIAQWREEDPKLSATSAHRKLRSSGFACEQGRFRELFRLHLELEGNP